MKLEKTLCIGGVVLITASLSHLLNMSIDVLLDKNISWTQIDTISIVLLFLGLGCILILFIRKKALKN